MERARVVVYLTQWCPYSWRARALLRSKAVVSEEIDIDAEPLRRAEMIARSGRHTVPQIFIGDRHVGGSDDLRALDEAGELDALLSGG